VIRLLTSLVLVVIGAAAVFAQTVGTTFDMRGTWSAPDGTLVTVVQEGRRVEGQVLAPTEAMTAQWAWKRGDRLLNGVADMGFVKGSAFIHFPVRLQKQCPQVQEPSTDLELQVLSDVQMMGRFRALILRDDCTLVEGPWLPAEFTRQPFSLDASATEIAVVLQEGVLFDFDRADLKQSSLAVLKNIKALIIDQQRFARLAIDGHTDERGTDVYNDALSAHRAQAVEAWLTAAGVDSAVLHAKGWGRKHPIVPNTNSTNRAKNRRVEIRLER